MYIHMHTDMYLSIHIHVYISTVGNIRESTAYSQVQKRTSSILTLLDTLALCKREHILLRTNYLIYTKTDCSSKHTSSWS